MKRKPLIAFFIAIFIMLTILILFPFNCTYKKSPQEHSLSFRVEFYSKKAVLTGDYYYYRKHVGCWGPICDDDKIMGKSEGVMSQPALVWEDNVYVYTGKYGTVQDFIDTVVANGYSIDPNASNYYNATTTDYNYYMKRANSITNILKKPTHKALATLPYRTYVDKVYNKGDANPYASAAAAPAATANNSAAESLKSYKGNTAEFNAYYYYVNYADLQSAFGTNGDLLKQHYNQYGKSEGRIANKLK